MPRRTTINEATMKTPIASPIIVSLSLASVALEKKAARRGPSGETVIVEIFEGSGRIDAKRLAPSRNL